MAETDTSVKAPSPTTSPSSTEHITNLDANKPVPTSDAPAPGASATSEGDRNEESTIIEQTSEPERAIHVPEQQTNTDRPRNVDTPTEHVSPEAESLKAMFPDLDIAIVQSVLESVHYDQERAADVLLGMSDPNYVSQQHTQTQSELDEQLARRLVLEEQQQAAAWHPDQQYPLAYDGRGNTNIPYQPRMNQGARHQGSPPQQQPGGQGADTMTQVQEQFNKFAETGKKTFSSFMTKVKAKMQEFDQPKNQGNIPQQSSWGSGTPSGAPPGSGPSGYSTGPTVGAGAPTTRYAPPSQPPPPAGAVQGYDAQSPSAAGTGLVSPIPSGVSSGVPSPMPAPSDRIPPRPPSAGTVDPSKIGMLPKRPVSLLGSSPGQSQTAQSQSQLQPQTQSDVQRHNEDEDELDYVENPFEEGTRK